MAVTNLDIIKDALILLGGTDLRAQNISGDMSQAALRVLVATIRNLPGWTAWNEVEVTTNYTAYDDERITVVGDVDVTITLPQVNAYDPIVDFASNGLTVKTGNYTKAPRDGARVQIATQEGTGALYYAYRADTGKWIAVHNLSLSSDVPVNEAAYYDLSVCLSEKLAPMIASPLTQELVNVINQSRRNMANRYGMTRNDYDTPANAPMRRAKFY